MHGQPMYDELKRLIPEIIWWAALPTEETFESYTDSLVILDDMMDDFVDDSSMMKIFTECSHHLTGTAQQGGACGGYTPHTFLLGMSSK